MLLCLTLFNPTDCSPPGSSVHGILQARILEWVATPFFRGSSQPSDQTWVSRIAGWFFTIWVTREALEDITLSEINQSQKDKLYESTYGKQIHRDRRQNGGYQRLGKGEMRSYTVSWIQNVSFVRWKEFCGRMEVMVAQQWELEW